MLVAKAAEGHTTALGRYGITVDAADVKSRGLAAVLDVINEKFGGQAAAAIETYSGKVAQAANAWDNVKEALGKVILEDPLVTTAINNMVTATKNADQAATDAKPSLAGLAADFGLIDRNTAMAIDGLESFIQKATKIPTVTGPAAAGVTAWHAAVAALTPQMPTLTDALDLQKEAAKKLDDQIQANIDTLAKINGETVGWQTTLDTVDGTVAEAITYYLSAGVSQADLAKAYGLTAQQVAAVKIALEDYSKTLEATADFEKDAAARRVEISKAMTQAINDEIAATLKKQQADEAANAAFLAGALKDAQAQDAMQQGATATAAASTQAAETIGSSYEQGFSRSSAASSAFRSSATADAAAVAAAAAAATATWETAQGRIDAFNAQQAANPSNILSTVGMFGGMQYVQTRDSGGPVVAGQSYLIGGGKAPELFTPGASGFVTPGGGGGSHVTQNIYITQPLGTADAIARAVADAQVQLMRGQGVRLPYGT
jgi:hypothetical protein